MFNHVIKLDESIRDIFSGTELMTPVLQVISTSIFPAVFDGEKGLYVLSDGKFTINSIFMLQNQLMFDGRIHKGTIVKLKKYGMKLMDNHRFLMVIDVNVITNTTKIINEEQLILIDEEMQKPISIKVYVFIYTVSFTHKM